MRLQAVSVASQVVEMGESRTPRSGFFEALDTWDDGLVAPEKRLFCLSVSMGSDPYLSVKLYMKL